MFEKKNHWNPGHVEERNSTCSREEPDAPWDCNENLLLVSEEAVLQGRVSQPGCYCLRSAPKVGHVGRDEAGERVCKLSGGGVCARFLRHFRRLLAKAACEVKSMLIYPLINCRHGVCARGRAGGQPSHGRLTTLSSYFACSWECFFVFFFFMTATVELHPRCVIDISTSRHINVVVDKLLSDVSGGASDLVEAC